MSMSDNDSQALNRTVADLGRLRKAQSEIASLNRAIHQMEQEARETPSRAQMLANTIRGFREEQRRLSQIEDEIIKNIGT